MKTDEIIIILEVIVIALAIVLIMLFASKESYFGVGAWAFIGVVHFAMLTLRIKDL